MAIPIPNGLLLLQINSTAHDYGEDFAEETVDLLSTFITDAKTLIAAIQSQN